MEQAFFSPWKAVVVICTAYLRRNPHDIRPGSGKEKWYLPNTSLNYKPWKGRASNEQTKQELTQYNTIQS